MNRAASNFVDFKCPHCGKDVAFPAKWSGTKQDCPWCFISLIVPEYSTTEAAREVHLAIRTKNLMLRRLSKPDRADVCEIMSDADSFRYLDWQTLEEEDVENWLERDSRVQGIEAGIWFYFGAALLTSSKLIALVSFFYQDPHYRQGGFNLVVNRSFRRQGYGTETCRGALAFAFDELNLRRVAMACDNRNEAAIKMLEKAGLRREGECIEDERFQEEWISTVWFAMLSREYKELLNAA